MALPTAAEATLTAIPVLPAELRPDDQVGPASTLLPPLYTVAGVPARAPIEAARGADVRLRTKAVIGGVETVVALQVSGVVYVRRYVATATVTRAATGKTETANVTMRPLAGLVVIEDLPGRLRPGDTISIAAP
jgi:hypothetical protein